MAATEKTKILLVSTSDFWSISLRSVLATLPEFDLLDTAYGSLSAYQAMLAQQPHILIIDSSLPAQEAQTLVTQIKKEGQPPYCIWITPTTYSQANRIAQANMADAVVTRSGSSQELLTAVQAGRQYLLDRIRR